MSGGPLRVALTTLGCKVNYAEMAELAGTLAAAGCDVVADDEPADVRVVNSCTVTAQADATTRQRLSRLRRQDPDAHLIVTGCSVDGNPQLYLRGDGDGARVVPDGVDAVFSNAEKTQIAGHILARAATVAVPVAATAPLRARAFVKVQDGCNHRCTYCIVWQARGTSRSIDVDAVRARVAAAVEAGHAEVVLTGVDLGSYGRDIGTRLSTLVARLLDDVGTQARIRLSSINANDIGAGLAELNAHPRLCAHWHIPLQSGSDRVLRAMHRGYRRAQYLRTVEALRAADPRTEITTDIMVGFPGETDADHADTLALVREARFLGCHVFRYSPRRDTPAAASPERCDDATARTRSAEIRAAATAMTAAAYHRALGHEHEVVWDRVDAAGAHGVAATYHEVVASPIAPPAPGTLSRVRAEAVEDGVLRATLLAP